MGSETTTIGDVVMEHVRQGDAGGTGTGLKHLGLYGTKHYYAANTYMAALGIIRSQESALKVAEEQKDALCWKRLAERHYAARAYPANQHLAEGSLDAYFKAHRDEILAAERKEGKP